MKNCKKCELLVDGKACKPCLNAYAEKYRAENKEKILSRIYEWKKNNKEKERSYQLKWRNANKEKIAKRMADWRNENLEKCKESCARWDKANPEKLKIYKSNRRARKNKFGGRLSNGLAEKLFKLQKGKCACCKKPLGKDYHMDHIMPFALGGTNTDDNIQLLRQTCNNQKHAKHPVDFMQSRGFLI